VREEVVVGKETTERTQQVSDTVRHTEVQVDRNGGSDANTNSEYDEAAYSYGRRLAENPAYRNRNWADAEGELQADYTRSNPGGAWERVKASVRRGWEEATSR